jgi:tetratricopeptide (TPR) repeat protein
MRLPSRVVRMFIRRGFVLLQRAWRTGDNAALNEAAHHFGVALAATPDGHPDRAVCLSGISLALRTRFERAGSLTDINDAVDIGRAAVAAEADDAARVEYLANLAGSLMLRSERTGSTTDLDEALRICRAALTAAGSVDHDRGAILSALAGGLRMRFERTANLEDLDEAVTSGREAIETTPAGHDDRAVYLTNLSAALQARFVRTGSLTDLDDGVNAGRDAVAGRPPGHPDRAVVLSNLNVVLMARFERSGNRIDLDDAVAAGRDAVTAAPPGPDRALYLSHLCADLCARFERTGSQADLDDAVAAGRDAVSVAPAGHPNLVIYLSGLSTALRARFKLTNNVADIDEAVTSGRDAIAAAPPGYLYRARCLSNLASVLRIRFQYASRPADLDEAVAYLRDVVTTSPSDHPDVALYLVNLCGALRGRFEDSGSQIDLDEAIAAGRAAVAVELAPPRIRASAGREWGLAAAAGCRWLDAAEGFAAAVDLIGRVAPRSLVRSDQEHLLEDLSGVASAAASCCVHAGMADRAVELFEQGHAVLLGQALDARTDLTALAEQHPELARQFIALREDLDSSGHGALAAEVPAVAKKGAAQELRSWLAHRREAAEAFDRVIDKIRSEPGFSRFLLSSPVTDLCTAAADGPIVIVNVSQFGSHALILTSDGVEQPLPLGDLTPENVYRRVAGFLDALDVVSAQLVTSKGQTRAEQRLSDTLGWLWDAVAAPVTERLGITGPPGHGKSWPRLWWCVHGLLSFLPLHAAGHHDTRSAATPNTLIDRLVCSYTPTIRALAHARRTTANPGERPTSAEHQILAVVMPHTPGAEDLPGAQAEAEWLQEKFGGQVSVLTGSRATRDTVCQALGRSSWVHFACHGFSDTADPSASRLLLTDHGSRPLTVVEIARLRLRNARLAFLSACSTARPGTRFSGEAIHLASAFQLAGYPHVIATLWPIADQPAAEITADIYTSLAATGEAATAVHAAIRRSRAQWSHMPSVWASHIHTGA